MEPTGDPRKTPGDEHDEPEPPPPQTIDYASAGMRAESESGARLKTLKRLPQFEAGLAAAKLEAAGIPTFIADQNISVVHPVLFTEVRLQVREVDFAHAEEVLAAPAELPAEGDEEEDDDDDAARDKAETDADYVEEAYRCPRCRRKAVDLLPLSPAMRNARFGCLLLLAFPLIFLIVLTFTPDGDALHDVEFPRAVRIGWLVLLAVLSFVVLTAKRTKRCRECGTEWVKTGDE